ncbi:MAG: hypothetical protein V4537_13565 [Pseudomonadota bacterium]
MTNIRILTGLGMIGALVAAPVTAQQPVAPGPARTGDMELTCPGLAMEMGKAAQMVAQAPAPAATPAPSTPPAALAGLASAVGTSQLEQVGRAYQQAQNAQQLANLQVLAARGGVNRGTATAAIGGLAALQQVAANGGNVQDAARSVATDAVTNQLAARIPGGKLIGGMLGGMFKKKPKPVAAAAAAAPVPAPENTGARERLAFLGAIMQAKGCK